MKAIKKSRTRVSLRQSSVKSMSHNIADGRVSVSVEASQETSFYAKFVGDEVEFRFSSKGLWGAVTTSKSEAVKIAEEIIRASWACSNILKD